MCVCLREGGAVVWVFLHTEAPAWLCRFWLVRIVQVIVTRVGSPQRDNTRISQRRTEDRWPRRRTRKERKRKEKERRKKEGKTGVWRRTESTTIRLIWLCMLTREEEECRADGEKQGGKPQGETEKRDWLVQVKGMRLSGFEILFWTLGHDPSVPDMIDCRCLDNDQRHTCLGAQKVKRSADHHRGECRLARVQTVSKRCHIWYVTSFGAATLFTSVLEGIRSIPESQIHKQSLFLDESSEGMHAWPIHNQSNHFLHFYMSHCIVRKTICIRKPWKKPQLNQNIVQSIQGGNMLRVRRVNKPIIASIGPNHVKTCASNTNIPKWSKHIQSRDGLFENIQGSPSASFYLLGHSETKFDRARSQTPPHE